VEGLRFIGHTSLQYSAAPDSYVLLPAQQQVLTLWFGRLTHYLE
jgi:hypothetical protein